jgi:hypothetical protein
MVCVINIISTQCVIIPQLYYLNLSMTSVSSLSWELTYSLQREYADWCGIYVLIVP